MRAAPSKTWLINTMRTTRPRCPYTGSRVDAQKTFSGPAPTAGRHCHCSSSPCPHSPEFIDSLAPSPLYFVGTGAPPQPIYILDPCKYSNSGSRSCGSCSSWATSSPRTNSGYGPHFVLALSATKPMITCAKPWIYYTLYNWMSVY